MRSQKTRGKQVRQLLPEQGIQAALLSQNVRRAQEQTGRMDLDAGFS